MGKPTCQGWKLQTIWKNKSDRKRESAKIYGMLPPKLYLVGVIKWAWWTRQRWFVQTLEDLQTCFWEVLVVPYRMFLPHRGIVIKCSSMIVSVKEWYLRVYLSIWSAQGVFPLGYYWLLNKRLIISEFFTPYLQSWGDHLSI